MCIRDSPKKDHPWAEPRHLSLKTRKSVARLELGVGASKKDRTGQNRKKVTKGLYFTYLWRSPHWSDVNENFCSRWCSRPNDVCQVSKWNFQGLRFYRGSNFPFYHWFWIGLTTVQRYCAACDTLSNSLQWFGNFGKSTWKLGVYSGIWRQKVLGGTDRTGKSHKGVIFHLFVEKPPLKRCTWKFV